MDNQPDQTTPAPIEEQPVPMPPPPPVVEQAPVMQTQTPPPPPAVEQVMQAPPPPIDQTEPKQKRGLPKFLLLGIVVIILILVLGGVGYFVLNQSSKNNTPAPTPTPAQQTSTQTQEPTSTPTPAVIEMKTFTSTKLASISFSGYTLDHPSDWIEKNVRDDNVGTASLTLTKGDYLIVISQGPFDGGVCVYTDAEFAANQGPSSDKRGKPATDLITSFGSLRRDQEKDAQSNNTYAFCQKSEQDASYGTLTKIGAISYKAAATPDPVTLTEMDTIIKSVKVL